MSQCLDNDRSLQVSDVFIKTTRYLRLGMVALAAFLSVSVITQSVEHARLGSVSAFYYTPVRTVFVATMIGIGVCLVCLKGNTPVEDWLLNCAGFFAPFVALVPTPNLPRQSFPQLAQGGAALTNDQIKLALSCNVVHVPPSPVLGLVTRACSDRNAAIHNNVTAAFAVLAGALALLAVLSAVAIRRKKDPPSRLDVAFFVITVVLYVGYLVWFACARDGFVRAAHPTSAIFFLTFIGLAVAYNARKARQDNLDSSGSVSLFARLAPSVYAVTAVLMVLSSVLLVKGIDSRHHIFNLEAAEVVLFIVFWVTQTAELWDRGLRPKRS